MMLKVNEVFILLVIVLLVHGEKNYNNMESNEPCLSVSLSLEVDAYHRISFSK